MLTRLAASVLALLSISSFAADTPTKLKRDENFFPICVWLQSPRNAERFKAAGINTYVGLWRGPDEEQFTQLKSAGLKLVCAQNQFALAHKDDPAIIAWMQDDEPDNAQSLGQGKGYGPPILPERVFERYQKIHTADSAHPILLNLGQGVAWDNYIGRGVRRNHPEDYAEYVKAGDIVSFDIYPATHDDDAVKGKLEYVAHGVERLAKWAGPDRETWNCIEAKLGDNDARVTPAQLRAEAWMSIIEGSRGLIYFVHQFKPTFREASLFEDPDLLRAVTEVNHQITALAPVLNSPEKIQVTATPNTIATLAKKHGGETYIFAASLTNQPTSATIKLQNSITQPIEVLNENRTLAASSINDNFAPYAVHIYKITAQK